jgi:Holliday junction resolvasome RuvABC endonuclease subunit
MGEPVVLGVDPGFARLGWAAVVPDGNHCLDAGVVSTIQDQERLGLCEDNARRTRVIARTLRGLIDRFDVRLICAESFQHGRHAKVTAKMAFVWGALVTVADERHIRIIHVEPRHLKLRVARDPKASKEEVAFEVRKLVGDLDPILERKAIAGPLFEHAYDAAAAALTCILGLERAPSAVQEGPS